MSGHIHRGAQEPTCDEIVFEDSKRELIFPTFVWSTFLGKTDNNQIIKDCYHYRDGIDRKGVKRSNAGGWQSDVRVLTDRVFGGRLEHIFDLGCKVVQYANECSADMDSHTEYCLDTAHLWVNINSEYNYNVIHAHPKTDLVAVYYPIHEKGMGELSLVRHDASLFLDTFRGIDDSGSFNVELETGLLVMFPAHLLHYVYPNMTGRDRISISFNLICCN